MVLLVPLTEQTRGLMSADEFAAMKPGALLVNVARGPVVDTDALVTACSTGHVRAALDVVDPEPLPPDHPLWSDTGRADLAASRRQLRGVPAPGASGWRRSRSAGSSPVNRSQHVVATG